MAFAAPSFAFADGGDSSASASAGFGATIKSAKGLMIRVPVDKNGRENTDAAEMRVYTGNEQVDGSTNMQTAWAKTVDASTQPQITQQDVKSDSSTHGFFGGWYGLGWQNSYYYYNYQPSYYYGNYYYNYYQNPYYNTYYYDNYSYGYRYYYYNSCW